jgi:hypothetical protein
MDAALGSLGDGSARSRLSYLEEQLRILRADEPARDRVAFTLDPLAEYLAALHLVSKHGKDSQFWSDFVAQAATLQAQGETIKSFLLAVSECWLVRNVATNVLDLLDKQIAA